MPDPNKMGKQYPALADGTYPYAYSIHNPTATKKELASYAAMRLFDSEPSSWEEVTGAAGYYKIEGFPYGKDNANWANKRMNFPAYYYENGTTVITTADSINGHQSNWGAFTQSRGGYIGGSEGCQLLYPSTYNQFLEGWSFKQDPIYGYITIDRSIFGDGTNGKNNWAHWDTVPKK